jgi:hypothetical protein
MSGTAFAVADFAKPAEHWSILAEWGDNVLPWQSSAPGRVPLFFNVSIYFCVINRNTYE